MTLSSPRGITAGALLESPRILEFDGPKITTKLYLPFHPGRKLQEIVIIIIVTFFACWDPRVSDF